MRKGDGRGQESNTELNTGRGYKFLEHITDAEIEAYGQNLEEAFENAARATEDTMVDIDTISPLEEKSFELRGNDLESLLYSWLEELISLQDTESLLFSKFVCKISEEKNAFRLDAKIFGEKFDRTKHEQKTAIKAPTYHRMKIIQEQKLVTLRFVLDL